MSRGDTEDGSGPGDDGSEAEESRAGVDVEGPAGAESDGRSSVRDDGANGETGTGTRPLSDTGNDGPGRRHGRVTSHRTPPGSNALVDWPRARHPVRVALQYLAVWVVRVSPSLWLKRWLLRRMGATIESGVAWGLEATPDVFWPDRITVREDAVIGYDATLLCHEFLQEEYRVGEIEVGERAMIGAGAVVLPGVEVGADASVAANSLVTRDVPPGATVAGVPATPMGRDGVAGERTGDPDGGDERRGETRDGDGDGDGDR